MDYGDILGRAWRITWNNKFLWWLGLFLSLTGGGSNFGRGANNMSNSDLPASDFGAPEFFGPAVIPIICFVFLLALAFWVLSLIGRGGLIGGVNQIETDGTSTFRASWQVGTGKLWRLLGVSIIGGLPGLILAVMAIIFAFGVIGTSGLAAVSEDPSAALAGLGGLALIALICFIPLTCIAILASLFLAILRPFADRSAVLEDEPVIASYQRGWQVFRDNLGDSIVLGIISLRVECDSRHNYCHTHFRYRRRDRNWVRSQRGRSRTVRTCANRRPVLAADIHPDSTGSKCSGENLLQFDVDTSLPRIHCRPASRRRARCGLAALPYRMTQRAGCATILPVAFMISIKL